MIKTITLTNTRCFRQKHLKFDHFQTYMFGDNGVGKTTILEAIHMIATTKSHRTNQDKDLIQEGSSFSKISLVTNQHTYDMVLTDKGKRVWLNGVEKRKLSQFIGHLNVVMFAPEDIELIKGSPSYRRQFLDISMIQIDASYLDVLSKYKKILKQRNVLLKKLDVHGDFTFLNILSEQLLIEAATIIEKRQQLIDILNTYIQTITKQFELNRVLITYDKDVTLEQLKQHLLSKQKVDIIQQTTTKGPHKDDFTVYLEQKNASQFASQGQQRLLALSLKLALFQYLKKDTQKELILLLDDVLSELDDTHQQQLLSYEFDQFPLLINSTHDHDTKNMHKIHLIKET